MKHGVLINCLIYFYCRFLFLFIIIFCSKKVVQSVVFSKNESEKSHKKVMALGQKKSI